ncbi:hypothetical protein CJY_0038 [Vibrio phage CJY]|uniref:Uncharacterized protein n=1 Tax=Vibrio phage J2 TaxID=1558467 RepID=A0A0A7HEJ2_9CAUD|nr:hypothetical protein ACQ42_gp38 [Vibrio phage J2]AIZ01437.1 hypothetical protein CJY_0038 [Vibrio phage CJY]AIZ01485.1 hypothetical protein H1_0038 [Vibrio phage H1]AIZ01533.1 hypothetical protein H2_0038 [Vibrio phage H2 SGB-2014]AIZ01581.1 hypothetical protein H3_0038 [Vibrio phage H3]AIZ01677.1 hypothetical protein J3_0038 [Vibrio phage J3]
MANKNIRRVVTKTMSHLVAFAVDVRYEYDGKYKVALEMHPQYESIWIWTGVRAEEQINGVDVYIGLNRHTEHDPLDWQTISFGDDMMERAEQVMARIRLRIHQRER